MSEKKARIYAELRFPKGWQRLKGHYLDTEHARRDIAQIKSNWRGREGAPTGHRIVLVTEEIVEEYTDD